MFWRWYEEYAFMEREPGEHLSQKERISQELFGRTFWGDYGGSIYTRYSYDDILTNAGDSVASINAAYGQGLVLAEETKSADIRYILEALAVIREYGYLDDGFSEWAYELEDKELSEGWTGQNLVKDWERAWDNLIDGWEFPIEQGSNEFWDILTYFRDGYENNHDYNWETYWESADSLVLQGFPPDNVVIDYIIEHFIAPSMTQETELF